MESLTERWGHKIRVARVDNRLSQEGLADLLGIDQTTVSAWERGKNAPPDIYKLKLAELLGVAVADLFPWSEAAVAS